MCEIWRFAALVACKTGAASGFFSESVRDGACKDRGEKFQGGPVSPGVLPVPSGSPRAAARTRAERSH